MNGNKVKVMAQGAMLASLFGVLGVINLYTGSIFDIVLAYVMVIGLVYYTSVSYTHLRAHETGRNLVCRLLLEKKKHVCRLLLEKKNDKADLLRELNYPIWL